MTSLELYNSFNKIKNYLHYFTWSPLTDNMLQDSTEKSIYFDNTLTLIRKEIIL